METTQLAHAHSYELEASAETLSRLNNWVKLPTHISNISNIYKLQESIALELEALGFVIEFIPDKEVAVMVASTPMAKLMDGGITLVGHVDTALVGGGQIEIQKNWARAIGVGDDKGGVMVGLRALEKIGRNNIKNMAIRFVLSPNEETGSPGFHSYFNKLSMKTDWVLGLEPALASGDLIDARGGNRWYHMKYEGIGAHAGRFNEAHANPIHAMASLITQLIPLNNDNLKRRVNATDIKVHPGIVNAIPNSAELKIDARFAKHCDLDLIDALIRENLESTGISCPVTSKHVSASLKILDDCPALERKGPDWFYQSALNSISKYEKVLPCCRSTGGASDANHFNQARMGVIDGLGPITRGMHTANEKILISSLETRSNALADLIHILGGTHA